MHWSFRHRKASDNAEKSPGKELLDDSRRIMSSFVLTIIAALLTVPLFIILYRYIPDVIIGGVRIDHVLTIALLFTILRVAAYFIRYFLYGATAVTILIMIVGQMAGGFGFTDVYHKYRDLITYIGSNPVRIAVLGETKTNIPDAERIIAAIDYQNPEVRDFAVRSAKKFFTKESYDLNYRHVVQYFSVFRVMSSWKYIQDPKWEEYYAKASESMTLMSGDCDDYSILMAACIKSIGGEVRLVRTPRHLYPEVKVCTFEDLPVIIDLVKNRLFFKESLGDRIYYHLDEWNNVWLNFDYTNIYPGGAFMSEEIIGIMQIP